MDESSPRSREVANALLQIDRLTETQVRSILRHVAIDDAVLNEAQCSHVAGVINGTLSKEPREGVNASLTCGTSLDAASHWEKSFATQPGHVSATLRKKSANETTKDEHCTKQLVLFKPEEVPPPLIGKPSADTKPSIGSAAELVGLSITNQGQLTLHYHSYNAAPSSVPQQATGPLKRALDQTEDEQYSEALSSLMDFNMTPQDFPKPLRSSKRQRMEEPGEPKIETVEPKVGKPRRFKQAKKQRTQKPKKKEEDMCACKKCGKDFHTNSNDGNRKRCCYHPGTFNVYPHGVTPYGRDGVDQEPLYHAFSCCQQGPGSMGCTRGKHERDDT